MTGTSTSPSTTIWSSSRPASLTRPTTPVWRRTSWPRDAAPPPQLLSMVNYYLKTHSQWDSSPRPENSCLSYWQHERSVKPDTSAEEKCWIPVRSHLNSKKKQTWKSLCIKQIPPSPAEFNTYLFCSCQMMCIDWKTCDCLNCKLFKLAVPYLKRPPLWFHTDSPTFSLTSHNMTVIAQRDCKV